MTQKGNGKVIWLYGRPCSGKSTLSYSISEALKKENIPVILLDGDELRHGINSDLGYTLNDRSENIRRASEIAKLMAKQGFWVICSFVTPTRELRDLVSTINNESELIVIYIHATLEVCAKRDVKGHYFEAKKQNILNFTGISSPFEEPLVFNKVIDTVELNIHEATEKCLELIMHKSTSA